MGSHESPPGVTDAIENARGVVFDIDGSLLVGRSIRDGAVAIVEQLTQRGKRVGFLSNDSTSSVSELCARMAHLGLNVRCADIITPNRVAGVYLSDRFGTCSVNVFGNLALELGIVDGGHSVCTADERGDVVVVGRDESFTFESLVRASTLVQTGSRFVATNLDYSHPIEGGILSPQTGSIVASIAAVSGVCPETIGKPSSFMFDQMQERLDLDCTEIVMVGDNPSTDIRGGNRAGFTTVLVSGPISRPASGLVRRFQLLFGEADEGDTVPDYVVADLCELTS